MRPFAVFASVDGAPQRRVGVAERSRGEPGSSRAGSSSLLRDDARGRYRNLSARALRCQASSAPPRYAWLHGREERVRRDRHRGLVGHRLGHRAAPSRGAAPSVVAVARREERLRALVDEIRAARAALLLPGRRSRRARLRRAHRRRERRAPRARRRAREQRRHPGAQAPLPDERRGGRGGDPRELLLVPLDELRRDPGDAAPGRAARS